MRGGGAVHLKWSARLVSSRLSVYIPASEPAVSFTLSICVGVMSFLRHPISHALANGFVALSAVYLYAKSEGLCALLKLMLALTVVLTVVVRESKGRKVVPGEEKMGKGGEMDMNGGKEKETQEVEFARRCKKTEMFYLSEFGMRIKCRIMEDNEHFTVYECRPRR